MHEVAVVHPAEAAVELVAEPHPDSMVTACPATTPSPTCRSESRSTHSTGSASTSRAASRATRPSCGCAAPARRASVRTSPTAATSSARSSSGAGVCRSPASTRSTRSRSCSTGSSCSRSRRRSTPGATTAAGRSSRRRSTSRCGRRGVARRRARPRGAAGAPTSSSTRATDLGALLALYPSLRFKLDPTPEWTDELVADARGARRRRRRRPQGRVQGTVVDNPPDAELYRRVAEGFPDAWIEDPGADRRDRRGARAAPRPDHVGRADPSVAPTSRRCRSPPRCLNVKPSRFGSLARLFEFYDRCERAWDRALRRRPVRARPGRGQIQFLGVALPPDSPNDVAPSGYHAETPGAG